MTKTKTHFDSPSRMSGKIANWWLDCQWAARRRTGGMLQMRMGGNFAMRIGGKVLMRFSGKVRANTQSGARPAYITVQLGRGLGVFYRDGATWINDQDDKREMNKIEAPIRPTTPNYS